MDQLLKESLFSPIDWQGALYTAPISRRFLIRSAPALEKIGAALWPALSGVIIVEATKQLYHGIPALSRVRASPMFRPVLIPGHGASAQLAERSGGAGHCGSTRVAPASHPCRGLRQI